MNTERDMENEFRFKPVKTNPDLAFQQLKKRMNDLERVVNGVSPLWKYASVAACLMVVCLSVSLFMLKQHDRADKPLFSEIISGEIGRAHV